MVAKLELELPCQALLRMMPLHPDLVQTVIGELGLAEWQNSYRKTCHWGLGGLLLSVEGQAFVAEGWGFHVTDGTPLEVSEKRKPPKNMPEDEKVKWLEEMGLQCTARVDFLKKTDQVVREVAKRLGEVVTPKATLETQIEEGSYIYLIVVANSKVFKLGHWKIAKTKHRQGCFKDRYWSDRDDRLKQAPDLGPHWDGEWCLERLSLEHYVKGSEGQEHEIHRQLRELAVDLDFLPCPGRNEFHDARLLKKAIGLMNGLVAKAAKPVELVVPEVPEDAPPISGLVLTRPMVSNLKKELKEGKPFNWERGQDPERMLRDDQILRKVAKLQQHFEAWRGVGGH